MNTTKSIIPSTCWECSAHCGSLVTVEDGRVTRVSPNPEHPASLGAFCVKGIRGLPELTYHPDRVLHPMKRTGPRGGGRWQRVSWDQALDEMADAMLAVRERYGPTALCGAVSNAHFSRGVMVALLLRAFGSPNWMMNQDLCGGCRALSDRITGLAIGKGEDIDNTRCALIVGRNPYAADPPQWQALKRARAKGASIVVIDPGETPAATIADVWLRPRPGTDAAIGLAMIHWLVQHDRYDRDFVERWCHGFDALAERAAQYPAERAAQLTGVPRADIERAAELYADGPSCFVSGHGIDAFSAGVQTFRAFHCLVAISGNLDREGGNRRTKRPAGFTNYIEVLHKPEFRSAPGGGAADHRHGPVSAVGGTRGLADVVPQSVGHRSRSHGQAEPGARPVRQRRQHRDHLSRYAKDSGGAQVPGFFRGGHPHDEPHRGVRGHRAAQDHRAGG